MSGYHGRNRSPAEGGPQGVQRSYASQFKETDQLFKSYEHLQGLPRGDTALKMLRQIGSLVKPIMRKRGWKVQVLTEFLPPEANLLGLNINRGYKICLRLRYHNNPDLFLPLEQAVDTMLHELCHIIWGEHDGNFHNLWDELRDEWETLTRKGYTGEGFLSEGKKLGGGRVPPPHEMRRLARASAEKRQSQNKLSKGSGQRLGGTPLHQLGGDVRQVIADQVTRRNTINKGCGSGRSDAVKLSDQAGNNTFKTKAEEDDANNRAIAQALYELMEQEEDRKIQGTFSEAPTNGGLAWHPDGGLYDPRIERRPTPNGSGDSNPSEEEQLKWAMQESMRAVTPTSETNEQRPTRADHPSRNINRTNSAPPIPPASKPSPVSAVSTNGTNRFNDSPISPMTPLPENGEPVQTPRRKRPMTQSSLSTTVSADSDDHSEYDRAISDYQRAINERERNRQRASTTDSVTSSIRSPLIDISEPWDPNAAPPDEWSCEICTCINPLQFLACDACGTERPQNIGIGNRGARPKLTSRVSAPAPAASAQVESLGWNCTQCGSFMEHRWWTCSSCGKMKDSS